MIISLCSSSGMIRFGGTDWIHTAALQAHLFCILGIFNTLFYSKTLLHHDFCLWMYLLFYRWTQWEGRKDQRKLSVRIPVKRKMSIVTTGPNVSDLYILILVCLFMALHTHNFPLPLISFPKCNWILFPLPTYSLPHRSPLSIMNESAVITPTSKLFFSQQQHWMIY